MAKNIRRTAMGDAIDMDMLRLANETTIAVGNMNVNARGDQLGPGGKIIKTRAQVMQEMHALNVSTPVADHSSDVAESAPADTSQLQADPAPLLQPTAEDIPVAESDTTPNYVKPRGSFADSVAKQTEVKQELIDPASVPGYIQKPGVQRI